ncbi:putative ABC transport system permease protein [Arthrobacter silviterrae]|uniref:ABC3 transporter permease C-terminal domain-containing protein n=1 Tax=Arthrobacter silviterrae TaxID=2026658 RepID=A0ABX0D935_9MICC|nr:ABC transporter permease [Arthrobacter silviterrae]MDQ0278718.1 putative ABC transport system permease protein [Arthrobacter silviterrae]NGN83411.1 hypothetical protein [Arthrobacter silviterrae]
MALDLTPVKGGRRPRLRLALTMAWRDIRRHKGRSALIMALIALPIFGLSAAATAGQSMLATPQETVLHELGQTQGRLAPLEAINAKSVQAVRGDLGYPSGQGEPDKNFTPAAPADVVPPGYRAIASQYLQATSPVGQAQVPLQAVVTDVLDPAFAGKYRLLEGAAPSGAGQAVGSPGLFSRFGLQPGGTLTTSAGTFELVGTVRDAGVADGNTVLYLKRDQVPASMAGSLSPAVVYLAGDRPLGWNDAKAFNAMGVQLTSRSLILDPPSLAERPVQPNDAASDGRLQNVLSLAVLGSLVGVLALLEVGLLAGAAFAVGARKQQRDLALLAASGAEAGMLRSVVTASGVWLGLAGGAIGVVLGTVAASIGVLAVRAAGQTIFSGLHVQWLGIVLLVAVGLVSGWLAALVPARAVSKQATLSALKSGRTADEPAKWTVRIGFGLAILAAAAMAAGGIVAVAKRGDLQMYRWQPLYLGLIIAGAVMLVFALICFTGRIVDLLTARTAWLPIALRLAARDSARNRGRTVPAVAAVLAAATLSSALMVGTASAMQQVSDTYGWQANLNQVGIPLQYEDYDVGPTNSHGGAVAVGRGKMVTVDPSKVTAALKSSIGPDVATNVLRGAVSTNSCPSGTVAENGDYIQAPCIGWVLAEPAANRCELAKDAQPIDLGDWRCTGAMSTTNFGTFLPPIVVGGEDELAALLGHRPSDAARTALKSGGIVVTNTIYVDDSGKAAVISVDYHAESSQSNGFYVSVDPGSQPAGPTYLRPDFVPLSTKTLAAVVDAPDRPLHFYGVVSAETAKAMGMPVDPRALLITAAGPLSQAAGDKVASSLAPFMGPFGGFSLEQGPPTFVNLMLWLIVVGGALITLSAAGITAGLALADGRNDHATLAGVGADTRLRKALAGSQILMTALLGTVLGVVAGAIPVVVVLALQRGFPIGLPWLQMAALVVLVPLFGAAAAWLLTKGKLPMTRRQTLA